MRTHLHRGLVVGFAAALLGVPGTLSAQGVFVGRWTVQSWQIAPWVDDTARHGVAPDSALLNATVSFGRKGVTAPPPLGCPEAKFEIEDAPIENLFEGGLTDPKSQGAALGFHGATVKTLVPGCEIEYHLRDPRTALFALNNVVYTMVRKPPGAP